MTACAAMLMNSCQKTPVEKKEGVPMTIQASVVTPPETKTIYEYTDNETLEGYWGFSKEPSKKEAITVVSFGKSGITAVDRFVSIGEVGRKKAEFSGTWHGNEGDKVICLYPPVDEYAGKSIFDAVRVGSPTIYMRNLSTPSDPLKHEDTGSVSDVDLMLGEVTFGGDDYDYYDDYGYDDDDYDDDDYDDDDYDDDYDDDGYYPTKANDSQPHVSLRHLISVFRITATLQSLPYYGEPYYMAKINTIRIKCMDPDRDEDEEWGTYGDPVFVRFSGLDVTTGSYTGKPSTIERGPLDYYLLDSGNNSAFHMNGNDPVTMTFYVPVRFDEDLKAGYELHLRFGGTYYGQDGHLTHTDAFPATYKRIKLTETLPLENGKVYCFKVTI